VTINPGATVSLCEMSALDYFLMMGTGGLVDQCDFDGHDWLYDNFGAQTSGVTFRRSRFRHLSNTLRLGSNSVVDGCYMTAPTTTAAGAHVDGIEISGPATNVTIRDTIVDYPKGFTWGPTPQGGLTSALNITSDFGNIDGVLLQRCQFLGGAFLYVRETAGHTIRNVQFDDVVIDRTLYLDAQGRPLSIPNPACITLWNNVRDLAGNPIARP
jgi:hypothetical protein